MRPWLETLRLKHKIGQHLNEPPNPDVVLPLEYPKMSGISLNPLEVLIINTASHEIKAGLYKAFNPDQSWLGFVYGYR